MIVGNGRKKFVDECVEMVTLIPTPVHLYELYSISGVIKIQGMRRFAPVPLLAFNSFGLTSRPLVTSIVSETLLASLIKDQFSLWLFVPDSTILLSQLIVFFLSLIAYCHCCTSSNT